MYDKTEEDNLMVLIVWMNTDGQRRYRNSTQENVEDIERSAQNWFLNE